MYQDPFLTYEAAARAGYQIVTSQPYPTPAAAASYPAGAARYAIAPAAPVATAPTQLTYTAAG